MYRYIGICRNVDVASTEIPCCICGAGISLNNRYILIVHLSFVKTGSIYVRVCQNCTNNVIDFGNAASVRGTADRALELYNGLFKNIYSIEEYLKTIFQ